MHLPCISQACDVLRGSIVCKDFQMLSTTLLLLHDLDPDLFQRR